MKTKLFLLFAVIVFQCSFANSKNEIVVTDPTAIALPALSICDSNNDGFGAFDLTTQNTAILAAQSGSASDYVISYHQTLTDATTASNAIASPFFNFNPWNQTIHYRVTKTATSEFAVGSFELIVNPTPIANTPPNISVCDDNNDGIAVFNFSPLIPQILGVVNPTTATVTFYTSLSSADSGIGQIIPISSYVGSNGQTIWARVENNATGCYDVVSFQLIVNTPLLLTFPTVLAVCDDDANPNNLITTFDLTVKDNEITQGLIGYTVTYFPSLANAQIGTNAIANPTSYVNVLPSVQTLGVKVTSSLGCSSITTLDIRVLPIPTPNTNPPALVSQCDINNPGDMFEVFDLTVNEVYILNGDPNLTFHYYYTAADAIAGVNEILTPSAAVVGTNVWIRVENNFTNYQGDQCYVLVEQPLTVHPLPTVVQPVPSYRACDDNDDGITVFDLDNLQLKSIILGPTQLPSDCTVSYYLTVAGANPLTNTGEMPLPASYTNMAPYVQSIYIRVVNNFTGCVNATGILDLVVEDQALASTPISYATCDDNGNPYDGIVTIDLNQFAAGILGTQNPNVFLLSYYTSLASAVTGTSPLSLAEIIAYQTDADTDTIWVKVENSSNSITPLCYAITTINIIVERFPIPIIATASGLNTVYVDGSNNVVQSLILDSGVTGNYTYEWYLDGIVVGTSSTYVVNTATPNNESRSYSVRVENNSSLGCFAISLDFVVFQSDGVPPPSGFISQTLPGGSTLANIIVSGTNVQWYASASNRNEVSMFSIPLPLSTLLVDGTTYYASQTIGGIESAERLPVMVRLTLGIDSDDIFPIQFAPNPVKNTLTLKSNQVLKSVVIYTMLGQQVFEHNSNDTNALLDLSHLSAGNYIMKAQGETGQKTIRIIKE
jgi:hypothetical protein